MQEGGPESHTGGGRGRQVTITLPSDPSKAGPQNSSPKSHYAPASTPTESTTALSLTLLPATTTPASLAPSQLAWQTVTLQGQAPDHASRKQRNERNHLTGPTHNVSPVLMH